MAFIPPSGGRGGVKILNFGHFLRFLPTVGDIGATLERSRLCSWFEWSLSIISQSPRAERGARTQFVNVARYDGIWRPMRFLHRHELIQIFEYLNLVDMTR